MRGMILGLARLGELERQKLAFREQHKGAKEMGPHLAAHPAMMRILTCVLRIVR